MKKKYKLVYTIEPEKPVETVEEISGEVRFFFEKAGKGIRFLNQEGVLVFELEGEKYVARKDKFFGILGGGRDILEPYPLPYWGGYGNHWGFKFIYIYKILD